MSAASPSLLGVVARVLRDFPGVTPVDAHFERLVGYVRVHDRAYRVSLRTDCTAICGDEALHELLAPHSDQVARRLAQTQDAHVLLSELRALAENAVQAASCKSTMGNSGGLPPRPFYERLLRDIAKVGWKRVKLHESLLSLDVSCTDDDGRTHTLAVALDSSYPVTSPICTAALPEPLALPKSCDVPEVVAAFEGRLKSFSEVWTALDDFDTHCDVLEPEHPTRADLHRVLTLTSRVTLRIELDARTPFSYPAMRLLGAAAHVAPLRQGMNERAHLWDSSGRVPPRRNVEAAFGVELPPPRLAASVDVDHECGICYAYRMGDDGAVPDVACDNDQCGKKYHRRCLADWLRALPETRQSFDTLIGACVYCEHPITVSTT